MSAAAAESPKLALHAGVPGVLEARRWTFRGSGRGRNGRGLFSAHPTHEISWADAGTVIIRAGRSELSLDAVGSIVPAGVEHETAFVAGVDCGAIHLAASFVDRVTDGATRLALGGIVTKRVVTLGRAALDEMKVSVVPDEDAVSAIAEGIVLSLHGRAHGAGRRAGLAPGLRRALDLVRSGALDIGVDDLARAAHMSRFHFTREFRAAFGKSPYRFLLDAKLERSRELLGRGLPATLAAREAGFADPSRFARMFRRAFGVPPSAYARVA